MNFNTLKNLFSNPVNGGEKYKNKNKLCLNIRLIY